MYIQLSQRFRRARIEREFSLSQTARLCGYKNLSKGSHSIQGFESGRGIDPVLLWKLVAVLEIDHAEVEELVAADRQEFSASWDEWADQPITPYLIARLMPAVYSEHALPTEIKSVEGMKSYAAQYAKAKGLQCCLVLSRKESIHFAADGSIEYTKEAVPGESSMPSMQIGDRRVHLRQRMGKGRFKRMQLICKGQQTMQEETPVVVNMLYYGVWVIVYLALGLLGVVVWWLCRQDKEMKERCEREAESRPRANRFWRDEVQDAIEAPPIARRPRKKVAASSALQPPVYGYSSSTLTQRNDIQKTWATEEPSLRSFQGFCWFVKETVKINADFVSGHLFIKGFLMKGLIGDALIVRGLGAFLGIVLLMGVQIQVIGGISSSFLTENIFWIFPLTYPGAILLGYLIFLQGQPKAS